MTSFPRQGDEDDDTSGVSLGGKVVGLVLALELIETSLI
jgi:hypothetical protein